MAFYLDIKSRFVYAKLLREKTDQYRSLVEVMADLRARSGRALRFFKTDGDGIFTGGEAQEIYLKHSVRHIQSAPGNSASNDIVERVIRTLIEMSRTNLLHSGAQNLWGEAVSMMTYVWNNLSTCPSHSDANTVVGENLQWGRRPNWELSWVLKTTCLPIGLCL